MVNKDLISQAIHMRKAGMLSCDIATSLKISRSTVNRYLQDVKFSSKENALYLSNVKSKCAIKKKVLLCDNKKEGLAPSSKNYKKYLMAIELRKQNYSLQAIVEQLKEPKTTVFGWIKHIKLSKEQKNNLQGGVLGGLSLAREKAVAANKKKHSDLRSAARTLGFNEANGDPVHVAGVMLYWAEGSKKVNSVSFTNTDVAMQKQFKKFLDYLGVPKEKIIFSTRVHNSSGNATHEECKKFWSKNLSIPEKSITVYDANDSRGDSQSKSRYPFGVGRIEVYDYSVIQRIYGAIERYIGEEIPYGRK